MIYFKIENNTEAFNRIEEYLKCHKTSVTESDELGKSLGVEGRGFYHQFGNLVGFKYKDGEKIPEGLRLNKTHKMLVPNKRTNIGKRVSVQFKKIEFPSATKFMRCLTGVVGGALTNANRFSEGMGYDHRGEITVCNCRMKVWENAKSQDEFSHPEGLIEITATEHSELKPNEES